MPNHSHAPEEITERLKYGPKALYLREWIYGGLDGVVTTFALVSGIIGAGLSPIIVLVLGISSLVGDGFSMAAGAYSSTKAETDNYERLHAIEIEHIKNHLEGEKEETRQIFAKKGLHGKDLDDIIKIMIKNPNLWIEFMLTEEYGVSKPHSSSFMAALHTFLAFLVCGATPLIPYIFLLHSAPVLACLLSAVTFFAIGSYKSKWSIKNWKREGLETMFLGLTAAGLAFAIGYGLRGLIP
ncbi:MAG: VIT1/CCC1 transporter family protein [Alphaproteobacteria bacterium]|nr:VIT1/CCC1 transporter family protein [Alphaproteobacteria bacterium]